MNTVQSNKPSSSLLDAVNGSSKTTVDANQEAQDRFMTLLVSQMKNQDPLNPMDNAQVTSQLAQLSTVSGINKLNSSLEAFIASSQTNQALQASSMIGRVVVTPGNSLSLQEGAGVLAFELPSTADTVKVTIRDSSGNAVKELSVGRQTAGVIPLQWDGKDDAGNAVADGQYKFEVNASLGGKAVTATTLSYGEVLSVSSSSSGAQLNLSNLKPIGLDAIKQVY